MLTFSFAAGTHCGYCQFFWLLFNPKQEKWYFLCVALIIGTFYHSSWFRCLASTPQCCVLGKYSCFDGFTCKLRKNVHFKQCLSLPDQHYSIIILKGNRSYVKMSCMHNQITWCSSTQVYLELNLQVIWVWLINSSVRLYDELSIFVKSNDFINCFISVHKWAFDLSELCKSFWKVSKIMSGLTVLAEAIFLFLAVSLGVSNDNLQKGLTSIFFL